jgi:hypothetical protein
VQIISLAAKQYPSRIEVATNKEDSRKIAEVYFGFLDTAIDGILKDSVTFKRDIIVLLPYRSLNPIVPLVRL